ncbi:MAG: glycoside hydrolase family 43 protein [Kiritimatiellia bacterium]|nr:glycoside hydrolase family 43 protein [Kiritimatiellia bacterium]
MQKIRLFHPGELWLDNNQIPINAHGGGMLHHDGRYYWFGEHKIEGEAGNWARVGVHVYSSGDLYNWRDDGIALATAPENSDHPLRGGCIIERPKVLYNKRTGKFVMWFHYEAAQPDKTRRTHAAGIALSDSPTGPYQYLRHVLPNAGYWPLNVRPEQQTPESIAAVQKINPQTLDKAGIMRYNLLGRDIAVGQHSRDMTLFLDDDGTAYHIYSSERNATLHIATLTPDFLDYTGRYWRAFEHRWMEAPAIFKHHGKYYFIGSDCTGWAHNAARSAVADHIGGPWRELGNPAFGPVAETTYESQSTYVLPLPNGNFIFMADRWNPQNAIDGRYVWLPVTWEGERPVVPWLDEWDLSFFQQIKNEAIRRIA